MDWLLQNWIWVIFAVAFVAMHMFGHGGHGGHGGHAGQRANSSDQSGHDGSSSKPANRPEESSSIKTVDSSDRHRPH